MLHLGGGTDTFAGPSVRLAGAHDATSVWASKGLCKDGNLAPGKSGNPTKAVEMLRKSDE